MNKAVSEEQIDIEAKAGYRPLAIESGITILPLSELGDREFELLAYLLIKQEIENGFYSDITAISLMQGVSERGRDCVLYNGGKVSGLVQCKKYKDRLSRPQVLKEIIKFLLFSIFDTSILPDPDNFEYKLYVSNDFTEPAIALIHSYQAEIEKEVSSGNIQKYINDLIEEYESFSSYRNSDPLTDVAHLLKKISISSSNATDLSARIYNQENILSCFFNVKTVVSINEADNLIRNAFDDYGLRYLTDADLKSLQNRIGKTKEDSRVNLGFADFFGFSKEFFKYLKGEGFKEVMQAVASLKSILDKKQIDFLSSEINKHIRSEITANLLHKGIIHPFSVGIASPYLFQRLSVKICSSNMPKDMLAKYYPKTTISKEQLISQISETLFDSSERVMNEDYSQLVGNPELVEFKKRIFAHIHTGFNSIEDAKRTFEKDIKIIKPVLDKIEHQINDLISMNQTIVIKDASFFDDKDELNRMVNTIKVIDEGYNIATTADAKKQRG